MQKTIFFFTIFLFLFFLVCDGLELNQNDKAILEKFFRQLIENSEAGYVLEGKKPVCIHGYHVRDNFLAENEQHYTSVCLREGAKILKNLQLPQSNILIHIYCKEDELARNYFHILVINKELFLNIVHENLSLFQYVLGPEITPLKLLQALTNKESTFHNVLKNDKALIGILLGFGTQNSIFVSRIENLEENVFAKEILPYKSNHSKIENLRQEMLEMLLLSEETNTSTKQTKPSFGFKKLSEEFQFLNDKIEISSYKLASQTPRFIFGKLKDSNLKHWVQDLENTQLKIHKWVTAKYFLEITLKKVFPNTHFTFNNQNILPFTDNETATLPLLIAAKIAQLIQGEGFFYSKAFIEGMRDADNGISLKEQADSRKFEILRAQLKAKDNLVKAKLYFEELDKNPEFKSIISDKIYYRIIQEGYGAIFNNQSTVKAHYLIMDPNDKILADTWTSGIPAILNVEDTIAGFAYGLKGMKVGEIREILIHPNYAYGLYTSLEKGIYLKVRIQLINFEGATVKISAIEQTTELPLTINADAIKEAKKIGYQDGFWFWHHFKQAGLFTLLEVLEQVTDEQSMDLSSQENQDLINRLHWLIYHQNKQTILG